MFCYATQQLTTGWRASRLVMASRMRTFWTSAPHHAQGQHVQDRDISCFAWRLHGQDCAKSLPVPTVSPIHITSPKIDSHGRSWLTNVCSKPSQSEQGSQPRRQTFPANLNCSGGSSESYLPCSGPSSNLDWIKLEQRRQAWLSCTMRSLLGDHP